MPTTYVKVSVHKRKIINLWFIFQETNADDIFSSFAVMLKRKKSMVYLLPMPPQNVSPLFKQPCLVSTATVMWAFTKQHKPKWGFYRLFLRSTNTLFSLMSFYRPSTQIGSL